MSEEKWIEFKCWKCASVIVKFQGALKKISIFCPKCGVDNRAGLGPTHK